MKLLSKRDEVLQFMRKELASGKYQPGNRFLSQNALIRQLGISASTVREAISSLVEEGVLSQIRGSGTYIENLPSSHLKQLTLIVGNPHGKGVADRFIGSILAGLHQELDSCGWQIRLKMVSPLDRAPDAVEEFLNENPSPSTAVLAGFSFTKAITDRLLAAGHRVYTVGQPEADNIPNLCTDHAEGMRRAVRYLLERGHSRIVLSDRIRELSHTPSHDERRNAYTDTLAEAGIIPDARLLADCYGFDFKAGEAAADRLLQRNIDFTAAVVYGDWPALGFRSRLERAGMKSPEDVSFIGYFEIGDRPVSDMTVLSWSVFDMAREIGRILKCGRPEDGLSIAMPTVLIEGGSVKDISKNSRTER